MSPIDALKKAGLAENADGRLFELLPPLSKEEFIELERLIPCPLPGDVRELLSYSRGFTGGPLGKVDFSTLSFRGLFGIEEIFPCGLPIAGDGCGNFWILDLISSSKSWSPVFFACHDAPVIVFQTESLTEFINQLARQCANDSQNEITFVTDAAMTRIWKENPGLLTVAECLNSSDSVLNGFAKTLDQTCLISDLRRAKVGDGFAWGRYGPNTVNKRFGNERVFAYQQGVVKSFFKRLFGN